MVTANRFLAGVRSFGVLVLLVLGTGTTLPVVRAAGADQPGRNQGTPVRTDRYGDPLPPGALFRLGTVRLRHSGPVFFVAFTRDGKTLISKGSETDKVVRLWDPVTGQERRRFGEGSDYLHNASLSPDGTTLASTGNEGIVYLWDVATGQQERRFQVPGIISILKMAFSPDGRTLACSTGHPEKRLLLWDLTTNREVDTLLADTEHRCRAVAFSLTVMDCGVGPKIDKRAEGREKKRPRITFVVTPPNAEVNLGPLLFSDLPAPRPGRLSPGRQ